MGSSTSTPMCSQDSRVPMVCPLELSQSCQTNIYGDYRRSQDSEVNTGLVNWEWATSISGGSFFAGFASASILFLIINWWRAKRKRKRGEKGAQTTSNSSPQVRKRGRRTSREDDDDPEPSRWRWPRPSWPQWPASPWAAQPQQPLGMQVMQTQPLMSSPPVIHTQPQAVVVQPSSNTQPAPSQNLPSMTF